MKTCVLISGLPRNQVFGSGTLLDTQRLRNLISKKINVSEQSIHLYVLVTFYWPGSAKKNKNFMNF